MAKTLNINGSDLTNFSEYPNTFKRQGAFPLDAYSLFTSLTAAKTYASSDPRAYVGQTLSVIENGVAKVYVIENEQGKLGLSGNGITIKDSYFENTANIYSSISSKISKIKICFIGEINNASSIRFDFDIYSLDADDIISKECRLGDEVYTGLIVGEIEIIQGINNLYVSYKIKTSQNHIWYTRANGSLILGYNREEASLQNWSIYLPNSEFVNCEVHVEEHLLEI